MNKEKGEREKGKRKKGEGGRAKVCLFLLFTFTFLLSAPAFGESVVVQTGVPLELKVTLLNMQTQTDYKDVQNGVSKISGVTGLLPYKISSGEAVFTGKFTGDAEMFMNDVQAFATDKYKVDKKESKNTLSITLKKL